ncbi:hypothetical protein [Mycolicibacterium bacteremicum]|uniref:T3SS (YopN, CesT) and YbjN peptide-binding chaperone 1 n=1 Tax=Mycolicibacterium bacteremicum TaxID=564198 RepID=UPI0026F0DFA8|nr:hypothetical protein [Mycolicibacterium bacteremicum]
MPGDLADVRHRAHQFLAERFGAVRVNDEGDVSLRHQSVRLFVKANTRDPIDWTWLALEVPLLFDIPDAPMVLEYVALHADDYVFGHLTAQRTDTGLMILLSHSLLGDHLDAPELVKAAGFMLANAEKVVGELHSRFGGTRFNAD